MEPHQNGGSNGKSAQPNNYLCRQSSTRWTPTTDQIKILKDLYYKEGVRSPNADQIQKISAQLRQFGKIEGKNVFYWFQNHKARERQKKRFTATAEQQQQLYQRQSSNLIYPNYTPGLTCPSSSAAGMVSVCGYGNMSMESNYQLKECGIPGCGNGGMYTHPSQSWNQWNTNGVMNPYNHHQPYTLMESARAIHLPSNHDQLQFSDYEDQDENNNKSPELETLPLFPVHAEDSTVTGSNFYGTNMMANESDNNNNAYNGCHWLNQQASLELSLNLNSYGDHQWQNY
ncbi:hypothetical protein V2J09_021782 [Rumex salicifolius]